MFIGAEKVEDVTEERIRAELSKVQAQAPTQWVRRSSRSTDKEELVVSLLQYCIYPSDGDRDFYIHVLSHEKFGFAHLKLYSVMLTRVIK